MQTRNKRTKTDKMEDTFSFLTRSLDMDNDGDDEDSTSLSALDAQNYQLNNQIHMQTPQTRLSQIRKPTTSAGSVAKPQSPYIPRVHTKPLPDRTLIGYDTAYQKYCEWRNQKYDTMTTNEEILYDFIVNQSSNLKPPSVCARYSMLKYMINLREGVDVGVYYSIHKHLKKIMSGHCPKKSTLLTSQDIETFLTEAPDSKYLAMKVALILGVSGQLHREELTRMQCANINDIGHVLIVTVDNYQMPGTQKTFTISSAHYIDLYRLYIATLPEERENDRLFWKYADGKCTKQNMGVNQFGLVPKVVAAYLKLPNPKEYSAQCFKKCALLNNYSMPAVSRATKEVRDAITQNLVANAAADEMTTTPMETTALPFAEQAMNSNNVNIPNLNDATATPFFKCMQALQDSVDATPPSQWTGPDKLIPASAARPKDNDNREVVNLKGSGIILNDCKNCTINLYVVPEQE